ncbi:MAG: RNA polymerase sigma factor SigF [Oscillatoriales cyanobacterium]|jgi:RNA polymerase sigma-B factor|nr:MAG: RNA polymerase sigma factor SigF [Oscillatoriales cyanobacterium]
MAKTAHHNLKGHSLELLQQYRQEPSTQVRNQIVQINLGLVRKEVHHWMAKCSESYDDLLQVGSMGLIRAIERFDASKGVAFSSFAVPYIRGEIQHYLRDRSTTVRIPRQCIDLKRKASRVAQTLRDELGRMPNDHEIAARLGVSLDALDDAHLGYRNRDLLSLDAPVSSQEEESLSLGSTVPDQRYRSFQLAEEDRLLLQQALTRLEAGTCKVLEFVFLHDMTQKETAEELGISAVTVSRRLKNGLAALRSSLQGNHDRPNSKN